VKGEPSLTAPKRKDEPRGGKKEGRKKGPLRGKSSDEREKKETQVFFIKSEKKKSSTNLLLLLRKKKKKKLEYFLQTRGGKKIKPDRFARLVAGKNTESTGKKRKVKHSHPSL